MRVVYFGSGAFGVPTFRMLAREHELLAVVTQPDRRAGRGKAVSPTPIASEAASRIPGLPVLKPERVNEAEVRDRIRAFDADVWVVIAFGQKLGRSLLADRFAMNLHASLLPRWRGAAPINAAIMAGDAQTGNTVITLAEEMDAGLVLGQSARSIEPHVTAGELHDLLAGDGPALVASVLERRSLGTLEGVEQDAGSVTLAPKLSKADGWVDFSQSAEACRNRVHGLTPWPGVGVTLGGRPLKLLRVAAESRGADAAPGTLVDGNGLVACGDGALRLLEVQPAGKKAMAFSAFARGHSVAAGEVVRSEREPC